SQAEGCRAESGGGMRTTRTLLLVSLAAGQFIASALPAMAGKRGTEYPIPTTGSYPNGITAGPDGNLWFTEYTGNKIGRINTGGAITEYPIPTADSVLSGIALGPDGNLWFTELLGNKIGRITTVGAITEYPVPAAFSEPYGIALGPDGNMWFTEYVGNR